MTIIEEKLGYILEIHSRTFKDRYFGLLFLLPSTPRHLNI